MNAVYCAVNFNNTECEALDCQLFVSEIPDTCVNVQL